MRLLVCPKCQKLLPFPLSSLYEPVIIKCSCCGHTDYPLSFAKSVVDDEYLSYQQMMSVVQKINEFTAESNLSKNNWMFLFTSLSVDVPNLSPYVFARIVNAFLKVKKLRTVLNPIPIRYDSLFVHYEPSSICLESLIENNNPPIHIVKDTSYENELKLLEKANRDLRDKLWRLQDEYCKLHKVLSSNPSV